MDSKPTSMRCSIIIATYGDAEWKQLALDRAFPSCENQGAHEIIVGHDTHLSIGPVRNVLASKASGDWLCFLDADDELAPGYLGAMTRALEREREYSRNDGLLLTPAVSQVRKGRPSRPTFYKEVDLLTDNWLVVGTLITRSLFQKVGGFEDLPHGFEDFALWSKAYRSGARVVKVPQAIYIQHVNPQSKHKKAWRDHRWQREMHEQVNRQLAAWTP